jgi:hypothetical protein
MSTTVLTEEDILGISRKLIVVGSRAENKIPRFYGTPNLTVLNRDHPIAKIYMRGELMKWVSIEFLSLAASIRVNCTEFRLKMKQCLEQNLGCSRTIK